MAEHIEWLADEGLIKIKGWIRDGLIDKQIAQNIEVSGRTFTDWKKKFSSIPSTLKKRKEIIDRQVENTLFKSAAGYGYTEVTEELTENDMEIIKKVTKQVASSPTATIFWLKNRKSDEWRDRKETQISGETSVSNPFTSLPEEELRRLAKDDG